MEIAFLILIVAYAATVFLFLRWCLSPASQPGKLPVHLCQECSRQLMNEWGLSYRPERDGGFMCTHCRQLVPGKNI